MSHWINLDTRLEDTNVDFRFDDDRREFARLDKVEDKREALVRIAAKRVSEAMAQADKKAGFFSDVIETLEKPDLLLSRVPAYFITQGHENLAPTLVWLTVFDIYTASHNRNPKRALGDCSTQMGRELKADCLELKDIYQELLEKTPELNRFRNAELGFCERLRSNPKEFIALFNYADNAFKRKKMDVLLRRLGGECALFAEANWGHLATRGGEAVYIDGDLSSDLIKPVLAGEVTIYPEESVLPGQKQRVALPAEVPQDMARSVVSKQHYVEGNLALGPEDHPIRVNFIKKPHLNSEANRVHPAQEGRVEVPGDSRGALDKTKVEEKPKIQVSHEFGSKLLSMVEWKSHGLISNPVFTITNPVFSVYGVSSDAPGYGSRNLLDWHRDQYGRHHYVGLLWSLDGSSNGLLSFYEMLYFLNEIVESRDPKSLKYSGPFGGKIPSDVARFFVRVWTRDHPDRLALSPIDIGNNMRPEFAEAVKKWIGQLNKELTADGISP